MTVPAYGDLFWIDIAFHIFFFNLQAIRKKAPTNENFHLTVSKCTLISMKRFRKACEKYRHSNIIGLSNKTINNTAKNTSVT